MKALCPVCKTPQSFRRRRGAFKLHQRGTGRFVRVRAVLNKEVEPSLREPGGREAIAIPAYDREEFVWCDGIVTPDSTAASSLAHQS